MPKLLQINVTANWASHGHIAENIGKMAIAEGWESWMAYGRGTPTSASTLIRIGNDWDMRFHAFQTRLFDNQGLASKNATRVFLKKIEAIKPDIVHLHIIHGYYLNYPMLFEMLKKLDTHVVWSMHDCWAWTGHCPFYDLVGCNRWQTGCFDCPALSSYPASRVFDRSKKNYQAKRDAFLGIKNLTIIPVSDWLKKELGKSFLKDYPAVTIHNGIDLSIFRPSGARKDNPDNHIILGVASVWDTRKGLGEFIKLRSLLPDKFHIILVGLTPEQIAKLPRGIEGIRRTENIEQLVDLYSMADVFVNPTFEDTFPTTNLEALACGTPVITYRTGGSPEAIDEHTGRVVEYGNTDMLAASVIDVCRTRPFRSTDCRRRAETNFDCNNAFREYINLYNHLIQSH